MRPRHRRIYAWNVVIAVAIVLVVASADAVSAGQDKVDICHINGQGKFALISIADPAYNSHIAHGDKDVETFFIDADGDGFGTTSMTVEACELPEGFSTTSDDCDDTDASVNPDAEEIPGNGIDDDCNPETPDVVTTVFVTSTAHNGNLGGLSGADDICQRLAEDASLPRPETYVAWLSTDEIDAKDRIPQEGPYLRVDGIRVATNLNDLLDSQLDAPIRVDEFGRDVSNNPLPLDSWTATMQNGEFDGFGNCEDWTNAFPAPDGGFVAWGGNESQFEWSFLDWARCNAEKHLYCFGK